MIISLLVTHDSKPLIILSDQGLDEKDFDLAAHFYFQIIIHPPESNHFDNLVAATGGMAEFCKISDSFCENSFIDLHPIDMTEKGGHWTVCSG